MRKITQEAALALSNRYPFKKSNTQVKEVDGVWTMFLHGNAIAKYDPLYGLCVSDGGYGLSVTTKERLRAVPVGRVYVFTKQHKDYIQFGKDEPIRWDGEWFSLRYRCPVWRYKSTTLDLGVIRSLLAEGKALEAKGALIVMSGDEKEVACNYWESHTGQKL